MNDLPPFSSDHKEELRAIAKSWQDAQRLLDSYGLADVSIALDSAILALQRHVEFQHSPSDELLKFFGLDDLKEAETWWQKDRKE